MGNTFSIMLRDQEILFLPLLWLVENIGIQLKFLLITNMMSTSTYSTTKRYIGGEKIHTDLTRLLWTKFLMKPNLIYPLESWETPLLWRGVNHAFWGELCVGTNNQIKLHHSCPIHQFGKRIRSHYYALYTF